TNVSRLKSGAPQRGPYLPQQQSLRNGRVAAYAPRYAKSESSAKPLPARWRHDNPLGIQRTIISMRQSAKNRHWPILCPIMPRLRTNASLLTVVYLYSNRVSLNRGLCFRETEFCAQRQRRSQRSWQGRSSRQHVGQLGGNCPRAGKSLRTSDCVVVG